MQALPLLVLLARRPTITEKEVRGRSKRERRQGRKERGPCGSLWSSSQRWLRLWFVVRPSTSRHGLSFYYFSTLFGSPSAFTPSMPVALSSSRPAGKPPEPTKECEHEKLTSVIFFSMCLAWSHRLSPSHLDPQLHRRIPGVFTSCPPLGFFSPSIRPILAPSARGLKASRRWGSLLRVPIAFPFSLASHNTASFPWEAIIITIIISSRPPLSPIWPSPDVSSAAAVAAFEHPGSQEGSPPSLASRVCTSPWGSQQCQPSSSSGAYEPNA